MLSNTRMAVLALALAGPAVSSAGERPLSLDEALALARKSNRDLEAARARLDQARAGLEQAWTALLPTLSAQGRYTHNYRDVRFTLQPGQDIVIQPSEQLDGVLAANVPLLAPAAYASVRAARKSVAASRSTLQASEASILFATAQAFYAAAGTDELVGARRHAIEVARQTLANAQARLEAGVVNRTEVTRAELALVRAEQAAKEAVDAAAQAYRVLATLTQLREPFHVVPGPPRAEPSQPPEAAAPRALTLRPEFAALERSLAAAKAQVDTAAWRWAPTVSGFGNARIFNYAGFSGDKYSWAAGLQLDWLLYDAGVRDAQRHLAQAQWRENAARLSLLRDNIFDEIANAERTRLTKRSALEAAQRSVALSRETLELVRVQHDAGTATQLDLLQAQDALVAAEVGVAQARFDVALADLSYERAIGFFPEAK